MFDLIYFPFYPWDRNLRRYPWIMSDYSPSYLKRLTCFLLREKIKPIDWGNISPYVDESLDSGASFKKPLLGTFAPCECVSQPDMISTNNMLIRRVVFGILMIKLAFVLDKKQPLRNILLVNYLLYENRAIKYALFGWVYFSWMRHYFSRDFQLPIN